MHGAWHDARVWEKLSVCLEGEGHTVIAPTLPGQDSENFSGIRLQTYIDALLAIVDAQDSPIHLVGHSMAGICLLRLACLRAEKIAACHFISAFIPAPGKSILTTAAELNALGVSAFSEVDVEKSCISIKPCQQVIDVFYGALDSDDSTVVLSHLRSQALRPLNQNVRWSPEAISLIPCHYIFCKDDACIPYNAQKKMASHLLSFKCSEMPSGHSPQQTHVGLLSAALLDYGSGS